jgi:hypothetical protein
MTDNDVYNLRVNELWVFKIIIIYVIFIEFIYKKLEEGNRTDDYMYTIHV